MDVLYLLVPLSVVLVFIIGLVFSWALRRGQFEDMEGPAYRILMDDDNPQMPDGQSARRDSTRADPDQRET